MRIVSPLQLILASLRLLRTRTMSTQPKKTDPPKKPQAQGKKN